MSEDIKQIGSVILQEHSKKTTIMFGLGPMADQMSHQMFQYLIFIFYYGIAKLTVYQLMIAFIIFAIWDSINDPIIGSLSDRTNSKLGKRRFWILISIIPFGIANVILFTINPQWSSSWKLVYMIIVVIFYDTVYTMFDCNYLALFSEMFKTNEERGIANSWKSVLIIIGVIIGIVIPTLFIKPLVPTESTPPEVEAGLLGKYILTGSVIGVLVVFLGFLFFQFGLVENMADHSEIHQLQPSLKEMMKAAFKNGTFLIFCLANLIKWFVFKLLTTIIPLYAIHVLGLTEGGILNSLVLLVAFLAAALVFPLLNRFGQKIGWRNAFILCQIFWAISLIPLYFMDNRPYWAIFCMFFVGIGLSGGIYYVEPILADIIDEDEVKVGYRRSGTYYGINGLINRYSTILVFVVIALVLKEFGWEQYLINEGLNYEGLQLGLKLLISPISIMGNLIVLVLLWIYPLHGERLEKVHLKLRDIRNSKRSLT